MQLVDPARGRAPPRHDAMHQACALDTPLGVESLCREPAARAVPGRRRTRAGHPERAPRHDEIAVAESCEALLVRSPCGRDLETEARRGAIGEESVHEERSRTVQ